MFHKIIKSNVLKYLIIFISILVYYYILGVLIALMVLSGFYSATFTLIIMTGIPFFLLSKFFLKKLKEKKYNELILIFLFIIIETIFIPMDRYQKNQAGEENNIKTIINLVVHDHYSPIFGK